MIDDPVSRSVFEEVSDAVSGLPARENPGAESAVWPLRLVGAAAASVVELPPVEGLRRVRVEVVLF